MITQIQLKELLYYDHDTGQWIWLVQKNSFGGKQKIGSQAGYISHHGYRIIGINGKRYRSSRLAVLYMTGKWPKKHVDHKNRIKDDDKWDNLREATRSQNLANTNKRKRKYNLLPGVEFRANRFIAFGTKDSKKHHLGTFSTEIEAHNKHLEF